VFLRPLVVGSINVVHPNTLNAHSLTVQSADDVTIERLSELQLPPYCMVVLISWALSPNREEGLTIEPLCGESVTSAIVSPVFPS